MDREKLIEIKELIDDLLIGNEPTDEELNYDDDIIEMYHYLSKLKEAMEQCGF